MFNGEKTALRLERAIYEKDSSISGFRWYDSSGYQTVDTGIKITVGELVGGRYTVIISEK